MAGTPIQHLLCALRAQNIACTSYFCHCIPGSHTYEQELRSYRGLLIDSSNNIYILWLQYHFWRLAIPTLVTILSTYSLHRFRKAARNKDYSRLRGIISGADPWIYVPAVVNFISGVAVGGLWIHWWVYRLQPLIPATVEQAYYLSWHERKIVASSGLVWILGMALIVKLFACTPDYPHLTIKQPDLQTRVANRIVWGNKTRSCDLEDNCKESPDEKVLKSWALEVGYAAFGWQVLSQPILNTMWIALTLAPSLITHPEWRSELVSYQQSYLFILETWYSLGIYLALDGLLKVRSLVAACGKELRVYEQAGLLNL